MQQVSDESQSTRFPAERAAADPQEERIVGLEGRRVEIADQNLALLTPIFGNGIDQIAPQVFQRGEIRNLPRPELLRKGKLGPCPQPARKMIPLAVIRDALRRNFSKSCLKFVQITCPRHLATVRQTECEITEPELLG